MNFANEQFRLKIGLAKILKNNIIINIINTNQTTITKQTKTTIPNFVGASIGQLFTFIPKTTFIPNTIKITWLLRAVRWDTIFTFFLIFFPFIHFLPIFPIHKEPTNNVFIRIVNSLFLWLFIFGGNARLHHKKNAICIGFKRKFKTTYHNIG